MPTSVITYGIALGAAPRLAENGISLSVSETGFDTMKLKYYARTDTPVAYAETNFNGGTSVGLLLGVTYANMFFNGVSINQDGSNIYSFEVQAAGLLNATADQPIRRTVSSKIQSYKTGLGTVPGTSNTGEIQGQYINLSCAFNYVTFNMPTTDATPVAPGGPLSLPAAPANPFTSITTPIYNYPYGWMRDGLDVDMINGTNRSISVFLVKESWVYIYPVMPG